MATLTDLLATKGHEVIAVQPSDTVLQAANLMNDRNIGGVVVLDGDRLAGIFTERDVLRRVVAQGARSRRDHRGRGHDRVRHHLPARPEPRGLRRRS